MNKHKFFALAALALFMSAVQLNGAALATHPVQEVSFSYRLLTIVDPGISWTDPQGLHIRNRVDIGTLSGDIVGTARVVYNADFAPYSLGGWVLSPPTPGNGIAYGNIQIFSNGPDQPAPDWSGDWDHQLRNGTVVSGSLSALSRDGRRTMTVGSVTEEQPGVIEYSGVIETVFCPDSTCLGPAGE